ncbi:MAG: hypothetical protein MJ213_03005, partial [Bacilli bacterium]|nr:hypothetical protein [Bacilli bacterium]
MKSKHFIALFGLCACFVCSSLMNSAVNKNNITPPDSFLPSANEGNGDHQSGKTGAGHSSNHSNEITKLKVTFDLNGGTYNNEKTYILNSVLPTSYFMGLKNQAPGYGDKTIIYNNRIFKGYSLAKDDPNIIADSYVVRDNITVYAQYDIDPSKDCVVKWLDNVDTLSEETYAVGDVPVFKGQIPIKEGKGFVGWNPTPKVITEDDAVTGTIEYVANYIDIT